MRAILEAQLIRDTANEGSGSDGEPGECLCLAKRTYHLMIFAHSGLLAFLAHWTCKRCHGDIGKGRFKWS